MAAVTGFVAVGVELARGYVAGCAVAVVVGAPPLGAPAVATAWLPGLSVAAYTPAAATAERATSAIVAAIRPARKLISSSRALTAARRRD